MSTVDFEDLLGRIRGLLVTLGSVLTMSEAEEVEELLDHAELGEGLRTLAWLLVEEGKPTGESVIVEIQTLAARMGISQEMPPGWQTTSGCDG